MAEELREVFQEKSEVKWKMAETLAKTEGYIANKRLFLLYGATIVLAIYCGVMNSTNRNRGDFWVRDF